MMTDVMNGMTTPLLAKVCRIYRQFAYPEGIDQIPPAIRPFFEIRDDQNIRDLLPPAALANDVGQILSGAGGGIRGYSLRLGCAHHVHLKINIQLVDFQHETLWVFMVDTHDKFSPDAYQPPAEHPDASAWHSLQDANRRLKEQIESAWHNAGIITFKELLHRGLDSSSDDL